MQASLATDERIHPLLAGASQRSSGRRRSVVALFVAFALAVPLLLVAPVQPAGAAGPCDVPIVNPIACENTKPGNPKSEWDVSGAGDSSIQGFATDISVNKGSTVRFKVDTNASAYRLDIYRLGYYGGSGARKIATTTPTASLPQNQPSCLNDSTTGLVDCGNWGESASWPVPADAVSGIYFARLVRTDTGGASHIMFVVRDDASTSALLFQTSDTAWQAYNTYGGNSLYVGSPAGRAYKVSYNRPFNTRAGSPEDWVFNSEYPMVRWLEANGYDVSYTTGVDSDRRGSLIRNHETFLSVGHDEYWSGNQRANVEAARDNGVNLAFFSGNEVFWKTRWETAIDGSGTSYRTLVSYKETHANAKIDPTSAWTGTWRDPRFSPPADGGRPENALTGTMFMVNGTRNDSIVVPSVEGKARFWRNTSIAGLAAGASATLPAGTLGYEWDSDIDNGFRPAGLVQLSTATINVSAGQLLTDYGSHYSSGSATHHLTLYKAPSGALVFGAGTVQWPWGLDANHDRAGTATDARMQQATVNLLADMDAQPSTLQSGLVAATKSTDVTKPTSTITSPASGSSSVGGTAITVSGTATDAGGGIVGAVEISVDGGATWHPATGRGSWSYTFTPIANGTLNIKTRAADDSGNVETPSAGITVTITAGGSTIFPATSAPVVSSDPDTGAVELGMKFRSDTAGYVTGVRFYKGANNGGAHTGSLWSSTGTRLATATFTNESASGWQQVNFSSPVAVTANTVYVVSYFAPAGHYAADAGYFTTQGVDSPPLHALANSESVNGVYAYGSAGGFPAASWQATNYWVDVVFSASAPTDTTPPTVIQTSPNAGATNVSTATTATARFSEGVQPATVAFTLRDGGGSVVPSTVTYDSATATSTLRPTNALLPSTLYTATVSGAKDAAGNTQAAPVTWTFTTAATVTPPSDGTTIFAAGSAPVVSSDPDASAVELGMKFRSDVGGFVTGVRFYKGSGNTGTHTGSLWDTAGNRLATATFTNESASGWQQVSFSSPVAVTANTVYVVSYFAPVGHYAADANYFTGQIDSPPLHALANSESPNGVYGYGAAGGFPTGTWQATNYWVDIVFSATAPPGDTTPPTVTQTTPAAGATSVSTATTATARFSEAVQPATVAFTLRDSGGNTVAATVAYDAASATSTLTPTAALTASTTYTATVSGAKDVAGNTLAAPVTWTFTTAAVVTPPPGGSTIFPAASAPVLSSDPDSGAVELGMKFRSDVGGFVTGVRFYKGSGNTGTHTGSLWDTAGNRLATATFTNESASGWQQVSFSSPVAVTANTVYVVSYFAPVGHYAADANYFTGQIDSPPLHALASSESANGVYAYGAAGGFPTGTWQATNYWVDVVFSASVTPPGDTTPPVISGVTTTQGLTTATVGWTTDEASDTTVLYGTNATSLTSTASGASGVTSHSVSLTGLASNTTYYYRVRSTDAAGNVATSPPTAQAAASFRTQGTLTNTTVADFAGGTFSSGAYAAQTADGEVSLKPTVGAEFAGSALPSGWTATTLASGGTTTVANGSVVMNGTRVRTNTTYGSGRSLEFVATLTGAVNQDIGFGADGTTAPWAMFTTRTGGSLAVRSNNGLLTNLTTAIPGTWFTGPHRFRIDWNSTNIVYSIDGTVVATHTVTLVTSMRLFARDASAATGTVSLDWMRLSPYSGSGTYTSRVLDAGAATTWRTVTFSGSLPTGTTRVIRVRTGNTATPGAGWSAFTTVPTSGGAPNLPGRYLQYDVTFTTTVAAQTPTLDQISFLFG